MIRTRRMLPVVPPTLFYLPETVLSRMASPIICLIWFLFLSAFTGILSAQTSPPMSKIGELEQRFADLPNTTNADALSKAYSDLARATILRQRPDSMLLYVDKIQQTWQHVKPQNAFAKAKYFSEAGRFIRLVRCSYPSPLNPNPTPQQCLRPAARVQHDQPFQDG